MTTFGEFGFLLALFHFFGCNPAQWSNQCAKQAGIPDSVEPNARAGLDPLNVYLKCADNSRKPGDRT